MNALIIGEEPGGKPPMSKGKTAVLVPMSVLALDGEEPKAGDAVDFNVSGKVLQVVGDQARVEIEAIEGQPINGEPEPEEEPTLDDERAELGALAEKEDGNE